MRRRRFLAAAGLGVLPGCQTFSGPSTGSSGGSSSESPEPIYVEGPIRDWVSYRGHEFTGSTLSVTATTVGDSTLDALYIAPVLWRDDEQFPLAGARFEDVPAGAERAAEFSVDDVAVQPAAVTHYFVVLGMNQDGEDSYMTFRFQAE